MKLLKKFGLFIAVLMIVFSGLGLGETLTISGFVSTAEARVGRPLTPVSVAGVGRRTVRRCAAGVYNC